MAPTTQALCPTDFGPSCVGGQGCAVAEGLTGASAQPWPPTHEAGARPSFLPGHLTGSLYVVLVQRRPVDGCEDLSRGFPHDDGVHIGGAHL